MAIKSAFTSFNRAPTHRKDVANIGTVTKWNCTFDGRGVRGLVSSGLVEDGPQVVGQTGEHRLQLRLQVVARLRADGQRRLA